MKAICLLALALPLAACTPEKAEALVAAVKAFEAKSNEALDAYEALFQDYGEIRNESQDVLFQQAYAAVAQRGAGSPSFSDAVQMVGTLKSTRQNTTIENEFREIRTAYMLLGSAYDSLPQGSALGARHVSCGRSAVAKLTLQLVNFASDVDQDPLYPTALRETFAEFKKVAAKGDQSLAQRQFDRFYTGVAGYEARHAEALRLTLAAVEQGRKLDGLLARYDDVTLSGLLGAIQYGFTFAGTLKGVDPATASSRLQATKAELDASPYWQRVEAVPLASIAECATTER
ncbi:hypothetical protein [Chitiniphilus eburneus]|uniref:DUF3829 domain-containing protein n=1 Tax=Chitiniphilus eburneus TaxID=2571148 RepID=A0A4U0PIA5_9NEIS|nr:hypothetical protein [Chitiniphilus eburneus]TJZ67450.1 hypothetical protein FAZ21_16400 [Chitiniphilus eburneus]